MRFKEITPGMVIHCPKEEDARALLKFLFCSDYDLHQTDVKHKYFRIEPNKFAVSSLGGFHSDEVTEFSDLIEPDTASVIGQLPPNKFVVDDDGNVSFALDKPTMTAEELMQWLMEHYRDGVFKDVFGSDYSFDGLIDEYEDNAGEVIRKITAYEAEKKEKPVRVECGYRCYTYDLKSALTVDEYILWGVDEQTARNYVTQKAMQYTKETGKQVGANTDFTCRVKEGKHYTEEEIYYMVFEEVEE